MIGGQHDMDAFAQQLLAMQVGVHGPWLTVVLVADHHVQLLQPQCRRGDHRVGHRAGAAPQQGCEWQFDSDGSGETEPPPMSAPRQHDVEPGVAGKQRPSYQCGRNRKLARPVHGP